MELVERLKTGVAAVDNDLPFGSDRTQSNRDHLAAAMDWLRRSQDATGTGGSAATYNLVLGWEDAYPETTGYIVPTMFSFADVADAPDFADRAVRMADWLCALQHRSGYFPAGTGGAGKPSVFNTGQILFGLVETYRRTGDDRYRTAAREACDWLVDQQAAEGFWDRHDYKGEVHAYSTRIAWAMLEAASVLPDRREGYRDAARRNLHWAVGLQRPNGWFEKASFESGETPYLHTIAYTVRGLLEGGLALDDATLVDAATRSADELATVHRHDGVLRGAYDSSWSPSWYYCLTGNAQTAIIWFRLFEHTGESAYRRAAEETLDFLKRRQPLRGPAAIRGGLAGSYPLVGRYMYLRYPNWAVKFLADALLLAGNGPAADATMDGSVGVERQE